MSNQLYIGAHIDNNQEKYNDVFSIYQDAVQVPSFTTKAKSSPAQPAKIAFRDVNSSTPHREDIVWLADNKISEGWKVMEPMANQRRAPLARTPPSSTSSSITMENSSRMPEKRR